MNVMRSDDGNGRQVRTVALTTFLTTLTAMTGVSMTVIAWCVAWGYGQRTLARELIQEMDQKVNAAEVRFMDKVTAEKAIGDLIHANLYQRIGEVQGRLDRLEGRR